jgi:hypothetical protein
MKPFKRRSIITCLIYRANKALPPTVKSLSILLQDVKPFFVVPAAFFYVLGTTQALQISPDTRYGTALSSSEERLTNVLQSALDSGLLNKIETPVTVTGITGINLSQAARRLVALGNTSSPLQEISGTKVSSLLSKWLDFAGSTADIQAFWTGLASGDEYLNLILQILSNGDQNLIDAIFATFGSPPVTSTSPPATVAPKNLLTAKLLLSQPSKTWSDMFTKNPALLPPWTLPGNTDQRINAYIQYIQTILAVDNKPLDSPVPQPNNVPVLNVSEQSALRSFFRKCPIDFSQKLDDTAINSAIGSFPPDTKLRDWIRTAIKTIHILFSLTSFAATPSLQFSYMEALYSRGFTTFDRITLLTFGQFKSALHGTVAFGAAEPIYNATPGSKVIAPPSTGFSAVNDGSLTVCIPPENLSPFGRVRYLHDLLELSIGSQTLGSMVSSRRGALGNLKANLDNLELTVPRIDLVNESLEKLGSNLDSPSGAVYNTEGNYFPGVDKSSLLRAIPEYSSPAIPSASIYASLNSDMTAPNLPYSQGLDVARTYLGPLGTSRFETMRHFRTDITEFALDPNGEPADFERTVWRLPVRLDIAIEYLGISPSELKFYSTATNQDAVPSVFGFTKEDKWTDIVTVVPNFLGRTGLSYGEFLGLWRCRYIPFSPGSGKEYPAYQPCDEKSWKIVFPESDQVALWKLAVFIRLWRKLRSRDLDISFSSFADICRILGLFKGDDINGDFVRQLISLLMLRDIFQLHLTHHDITSLLTLWSKPEEFDFLSHVQQYAQRLYACPVNNEVKEAISSNLKPLSRLAGFTKAHDWNSTPTCTLRFVEVLGKIFSARATVEQILFLFTAEHAYPLSSKPHMIEDPLNAPEHCEEDLWCLRDKLLSADVSDPYEWTWLRIENTLRSEFCWAIPESDALIEFAEHFFPSVLVEHGYRVPKENTLFRTKLSADCTVPTGWQTPPYGPFRYHPTTSELVVELPLRDEEVFEQLMKIHQLKSEEQQAVKDLYYAPRLAIVPFALIFSSFSEASERLINEHSEIERFQFFQHQFALFYRKCQIITEHLAAHVSSVAPDSEGDVDAAWQIIKHLLADENSSVKWETDSGKPPATADFKWNPLTGGAFAALLGLTGTGLLGKYKVENAVRWYEVRAPLTAFGHERDKENVPVPMIIPDLGVKTTSAEQHYVTFHNGFGVGDESTHQLGGVESFQVEWTGTLLIERHGAYKFTASQPHRKDHDSCTVVLERGGKRWTVVSHSEDPSTPWLHRGTYEISIHFKTKVPKFEGEVHRTRTGIKVHYCGPDTNDELCVLPLTKLFIRSKDGPMCVEGTAGRYLKSRYYPTLRDIRRTYQRAFKAILFARTFNLSSKKTHLSHHQHELGYLMSQPAQFMGKSYYSDGTWHSHHAYFDFNLLPIGDPYCPSSDQRACPSAQRTAALFDIWERLFDYTYLRKALESHNPRRLREPLWLLFHEASEDLPVNGLIRRLGVEPQTASIVLTYFKGHSVGPENLTSERWAIRVWKSHMWIDKVQKRFFTKSLHSARPDLWASDDPNEPIVPDKMSGNKNLVTFVQKSCIQDGSVRLDDIKYLNDGLRERARTALISWLCAMQRVAVGTKFATTPEDLSSLLLQDVQVYPCERSSRIGDAITAVQTFVLRSKIGLEDSTGKMWDNQFATFEKWEAHQRRSLYKEDWVQWEELQVARKSEAFKFFELQLKRFNHSMPISNKFLPWAADMLPLPLDSIQSTDHASLNTSSTVNQAITLLAQPEQASRPSLLASIKLPNTPSDIFSTIDSKSTMPTPTEPSLPLWFQGAVRLGTAFIRVAAAAIPPAGSAVMDEYYFWIVEGKRFSHWDMVQNADIGTESSNPAASNWDPPLHENDTNNIPVLLHWKARPRYHLFWTRIHHGVFEPPRRSEQGVPLGLKDTPEFKFSGRTVDSLYFSILEKENRGFRYDIATDSAVVLPQAVSDTGPTPPAELPATLAAFPYFVYFEPGAPLIPTSPFCTTMAIAAALRAQSRFEDALTWYRAAFDPLKNSNSWVRACNFV